MRIICRVYVVLTGYTDMPIEGVCIYATIRNPDTRAAWMMLVLLLSRSAAGDMSHHNAPCVARKVG